MIELFAKYDLVQAQIDLLVGTMLGDGSLQPTSVAGETWRYRVGQKATHLEYVTHKYELLRSFCDTAPSFYQTPVDTRTGNTYQRYTFNTLTYPLFKELALKFYEFRDGSWVKIVPADIHTVLTPLAVAYFYMDDGALKWRGHSNAMRICTEGFTRIFRRKMLLMRWIFCVMH